MSVVFVKSRIRRNRIRFFWLPSLVDVNLKLEVSEDSNKKVVGVYIHDTRGDTERDIKLHPVEDTRSATIYAIGGNLLVMLLVYYTLYTYGLLFRLATLSLSMLGIAPPLIFAGRKVYRYVGTLTFIVGIILAVYSYKTEGIFVFLRCGLSVVAGIAVSTVPDWFYTIRQCSKKLYSMGRGFYVHIIGAPSN